MIAEIYRSDEEGFWDIRMAQTGWYLSVSNNWLEQFLF